MPVSFLTPSQREGYGRYSGEPSPEELARFFHLTEDDRALIAKYRGEHNRLGFAVQLGTIRYLGALLEDLSQVPTVVLQTLGRQLGITNIECLHTYQAGRQRWDHTTEIRAIFGFHDFADPQSNRRLGRWLHSLCWTGTDRPGVLFDRATDWLLAHKVLLPGASVLERFVARVRNNVEARLYRQLLEGINVAQQALLEDLLKVPEGSRVSRLDQLRLGPSRVSGPSLVHALQRLQTIRDLQIALPATAKIPPNRIASLAHFAGTAKVTALNRLPPERRLATLVAFAHCMEATAQD